MLRSDSPNPNAKTLRFRHTLIISERFFVLSDLLGNEAKGFCPIRGFSFRVVLESREHEVVADEHNLCPLVSFVGSVLEAVLQVAMSAVTAANLFDVIVRNDPRKFAVRKQVGDAGMIGMFVVVCIKAAFAFHVVRGVQIGASLRGSLGIGVRGRLRRRDLRA